MNTNSNAYTLTFAVIMVTVVAGLLAFTATSLKPLQDENVRNEKMQSILSTIGVDESRENAGNVYSDFIKQELTLKSDGTIDENPVVKAFNINLKNEIKKDPDEQRYPIYLAEIDGKTTYVIPLHGNGLWDSIWGYFAIDADENTIVGCVFDHAAETPGLGAEIRESWFEEQYIGEQFLKTTGDFSDNSFVSVRTVKGGSKADDKHGVDAISGGTVTSDKLTIMVEERLRRYLPYFENN
ncbi:MAG TPA: NADH:ubiquinone reductase (Na(+)-transporting) subunit C [Lutibacter sp.]|nr:NADH:ubiquinone reductase (Na(+)-transporting) subunit C [Lutibacter sp.]